MAKRYARCSRCKGPNASGFKTCKRCRDALKVKRTREILDRYRAKLKQSSVA